MFPFQVPKYLSEKWKASDSSGVVGKLRIGGRKFVLDFLFSNTIASDKLISWWWWEAGRRVPLARRPVDCSTSTGCEDRLAVQLSVVASKLLFVAFYQAEK